MSKIPLESRHRRKVTDASSEDIQLMNLKSKLDQIRNSEGIVDKQTKSLINITHQLSQNDSEDSGPYSLMFQLETPQTTRDTLNLAPDNHYKTAFYDQSQNVFTDRLPNVISFDNKSMKEYEYSCADESNIASKLGLHSQSRNELCLNLKSSVSCLGIKPSPGDNSRNNDDNSYDDSLGILTPDQMDDMCYLDHAFSPSDENFLKISHSDVAKSTPDSGDTPSTENTDTVSTVQNDLEDNEIIITVDQNTSNNETKNLEKQTKENVSDKNITVNRVYEKFLPSIHSSVIDLNSEIVEPQYIQKVSENLLQAQRIEQTPSPDDLPLDTSEHNGEMSTCSNSQYSASIIQDSQTYSESKSDSQKSMETSKVSISFVTSITSLDGYQGDGEMSRPVSRGGEHSICARAEIGEMEWQNVPVTRRADPMTDSDFFTESDADVLDDHIQKGDRRAQVIDGALYGGKNGSGNPLIVSRTEDSCMESSGVYTDLENHRSSPVYNSKAYSNESSQDSSPCNSELSQKKAVTEESRPIKEFPKEREGTRIIFKSKVINVDKEVKSKPKEEKKIFLKKYKMPKRDVPSKLKSMLNSRKTENDNNQTSSKLNKKPDSRKEMLSKRSSTETIINDNRNKFKDVKSKVNSSPLQRSQTSCGVNRILSAKSPGNAKPKSRHLRMRLELGSDGSAKSSLHSSQSDISAACSTPKTPLSRYPLLRTVKKRENGHPNAPPPARAVAPPPHTPLTPPSLGKKNTIPKLSSSPVSLRARTAAALPPSPRKFIPRRVPPTRPNTLPTSNNKENTKLSAAAANAVGPRNKRAQTPQSAVRSPPAPAVAALAAQVTNNGQTQALAHAAKGVEALGVLVQYLVFKLDALNGDSWKFEAERWRGVAAAERSSAARADQDRQQRAQKDLDTIAECLSKISELEMEVSAKEETNARLQASSTQEISALANDIRQLKETIECLKHEVAESRSRLYAYSEIECTLRAQLDAARTELETRLQNEVLREKEEKLENEEKHTCEVGCDPVTDELDICQRVYSDEDLTRDASELAAEVRSLRAVVEMKQAEVASLRGARSELSVERELRAGLEREVCAAKHAAEELRERAETRQRDVDRLREENRRLRDAANRDRDQAARLEALNEELRYKLRQKAQVVTLLSGYPPRRPPSPASPPHSPSPPSPPNNPPAVKAVVEKHDSVSWVLEIEDSPEEVATRLARRSSFRTLSGSSCASVGPPAVGVRRREGVSPPLSPPPPPLYRPNPPSPPSSLKESAGEAIYIYHSNDY